MSCSLVFIISLYISARVEASIRSFAVAIAMILLVIFVLMLRAPSVKRWQGFFHCITLLISLIISSYTFSLRSDTVRAKIGTAGTLTVTVTDIKSSMPYMSEFYIKWDGHGALLTCEYPLYVRTGDTLSGVFHYEDFEENINGYPEKGYQFSRGNIVHLYSYEDDLEYGSGSTTLHTVFHKARRAVSERFSDLLSEESSAYLSCLLLGEREELPQGMESDFNDLGLSHLLAISGMHLGILIGGLFALLRLLNLHKSMRNILCIVAIFLFAALTGFPSSLVRAGVATAVILCCHFIQKRPDSATALCFAVAVIYAMDPYSAYDTGLTLSFMAALGIVTVTPLLQKKTATWQMPRVLRSICEGAFVTLIALTFTLPFTLYYFRTYTFASIFTTLLFSPFVTAALYLSPLVLTLGNIPILGGILCFSAEKVTFLTADLAAFLSENLQFTLSVDYPFARLLVVLYCIAFILLLLTAPRRWWLYLLPVCIFTVSVYSGAAIYNSVNEDKSFLSINETNRNDTICMTAEGKTTVIDISGATAAPSRAALYTAKAEQYAVYIENYILVNRTYRTVAFTKKLLYSNRINNLYLPADILEEGEYDAILQAAQARGTRVHAYSFGDTLRLGGISVTPNDPARIKRSSMPIHNILIETKETSVFYAGAAFSESELVMPNTDHIIAGSYGPLYKEDFSFGEGNVIVSGTAEKFYSGEGTVYEKVTNVILNND